MMSDNQLHQPRSRFITGGYLVKRWFIPAAARARGQSNDLNRKILASNLFNCHKEVINAPPVPSISRCIHIVYRHKNVWEYQWSNFIYNCMSTFLHYVRCKDALLDCSAPGGERCESLTWVDEIVQYVYHLWYILFQHYCATTDAVVQILPILIVFDGTNHIVPPATRLLASYAYKQAEPWWRASIWRSHRKVVIKQRSYHNNIIDIQNRLPYSKVVYPAIIVPFSCLMEVNHGVRTGPDYPFR